MPNSKSFLKLNDIDAYKTSFHLSNFVWNIVIRWDWFAKRTIGSQFVNSTDSISANIAEGFGRYTKKDKVRFYIISKGSLKETFDWNEKAKIRGLINEEQYNHILKELTSLPKDLNQLINFTNNKLKY
ncbi:four helix bundle protein [Bacteroidota bacterium]